MKKKLDGGKVINEWKIVHEKKRGKSRVVVKRWIVHPNGKGSNEHLPGKEYSAMRQDPKALAAFVARLNAKEFKDQLSVQNIVTRNAHLDPAFIEKFRKHLFLEIPQEKNAKAQFNLLQKHVIGFFVGKKSLYNPKDWYVERSAWAEYLLTEVSPSVDSKKLIIQVANRFMAWLHEERPAEVPPMVFKPLSRARLRDLSRKREMNRKKPARRAIPEADWKKIFLALTDEIRPWVMLAYSYGLRRSETLGLLFEGVDCIYEDGIEIKKQLVLMRSGKMLFGTLKSQGRTSLNGTPVEKRFIHHWLGVDPNDTFKWIEMGAKAPITPTDLTKAWRGLMIQLNLNYDFHELRHTWITRARAQYPSREVQLAAGHASIATTERYSHDHREHSKKRFQRKVS